MQDWAALRAAGVASRVIALPLTAGASSVGFAVIVCSDPSSPDPSATGNDDEVSQAAAAARPRPPWLRRASSSSQSVHPPPPPQPLSRAAPAAAAAPSSAAAAAAAAAAACAAVGGAVALQRAAAWARDGESAALAATGVTRLPSFSAAAKVRRSASSMLRLRRGSRASILEGSGHSDDEGGDAGDGGGGGFGGGGGGLWRWRGPPRSTSAADVAALAALDDAAEADVALLKRWDVEGSSLEPATRRRLVSSAFHSLGLLGAGRVRVSASALAAFAAGVEAAMPETNEFHKCVPRCSDDAPHSPHAFAHPNPIAASPQLGARVQRVRHRVARRVARRAAGERRIRGHRRPRPPRRRAGPRHRAPRRDAPARGCASPWSLSVGVVSMCLREHERV